MGFLPLPKYQIHLGRWTGDSPISPRYECVHVHGALQQSGVPFRVFFLLHAQCSELLKINQWLDQKLSTFRFLFFHRLFNISTFGSYMSCFKNQFDIKPNLEVHCALSEDSSPIILIYLLLWFTFYHVITKHAMRMNSRTIGSKLLIGYPVVIRLSELFISFFINSLAGCWRRVLWTPDAIRILLGSRRCCRTWALITASSKAPTHSPCYSVILRHTSQCVFTAVEEQRYHATSVKFISKHLTSWCSVY